MRSAHRTFQLSAIHKTIALSTGLPGGPHYDAAIGRTECMDPKIALHQAIALADQQCGVVTRSQLLSIGMSPRTLNGYVADGLWKRVDRGAFWTGTAKPPWSALAWSASTIGGPDALIAGHAAAYLHGLADEARLPIEVMVPQDQRVGARKFASYIRVDPALRAYRTLQGLRCVGIDDTVLDLCNSASPREIVGWVTAAAQRRLTTPSRLGNALSQRQRVPHRDLLEKLIDDVGGGVHSVTELDYVDRVERPHGLPTARRQAHAGSVREWVDNLYEDFGLIVEVDGRRWHTEAFRDRARDNLNTRAGHPTLRYGPEEIFVEPCGVAVEVAGELTRIGWPGPFLFYAKCP